MQRSQREPMNLTQASRRLHSCCISNSEFVIISILRGRTHPASAMIATGPPQLRSRIPSAGSFSTSVSSRKSCTGRRTMIPFIVPPFRRNRSTAEAVMISVSREMRCTRSQGHAMGKLQESTCIRCEPQALRPVLRESLRREGHPAIRPHRPQPFVKRPMRVFA